MKLIPLFLCVATLGLQAAHIETSIGVESGRDESGDFHLVTVQVKEVNDDVDGERESRIICTPELLYRGAEAKFDIGGDDYSVAIKIVPMEGAECEEANVKIVVRSGAEVVYKTKSLERFQNGELEPIVPPLVPVVPEQQE